MVQASSYKTIFDKGYMPNWTKKNFTVSQPVALRTDAKRPISMAYKRRYKFVDYNVEAVKGN